MNATLKPSHDSKVKFWKSQDNTFGTLPGREGTCPDCTTKAGGCAYVKPGNKIPVCYVFKLMAFHPNIRKTLEHNTEMLKEASHKERVQMLKNEFTRFRNTELKRETPMLYYRLHWSGDVFGKGYAKALTEAMQAFPDIHFWAYTRSLDTVEYLANNNPNLTLFVSLDPVNLEEGLSTFFEAKAVSRHNNLQIAYMSPVDDFKERYWEAEKRHIAERGIHVPWEKTPPVLHTCPVDTGKLPIEFGCSRCQGCVSNRPGWTPRATWFQS